MATGPRHKSQLDSLPDHIRPLASVPGKVPCLRCRKKFNSPDRIRVRICPKCKSINETTYVKSEYAGEAIALGGGITPE